MAVARLKRKTGLKYGHEKHRLHAGGKSSGPKGTNLIA
jgi:hypothetical protein